jgi:hypothetical protein
MGVQKQVIGSQNQIIGTQDTGENQSPIRYLNIQLVVLISIIIALTIWQIVETSKIYNMSEDIREEQRNQSRANEIYAKIPNYQLSKEVKNILQLTQQTIVTTLPRAVSSLENIRIPELVHTENPIVLYLTPAGHDIKSENIRNTIRKNIIQKIQHHDIGCIHRVQDITPEISNLKSNIIALRFARKLQRNCVVIQDPLNFKSMPSCDTIQMNAVCLTVPVNELTTVIQKLEVYLNSLEGKVYPNAITIHEILFSQ